MRDRDDDSGEWEARRKPANAAMVAAVSLPAGFAGGFLIGRTSATPAAVPPSAPIVVPAAAQQPPPRVAPNAGDVPARKVIRQRPVNGDFGFAFTIVSILVVFHRR